MGECGVRFSQERITSTAGRMSVADQLWCWGCSTIVRVGDDLFATHTALSAERSGLASAYLELFVRRGNGPWRREYCDECCFQREPCPIVYLGNGRLGVTVNPCDEIPPEQPFAGGSIASTPLLYVFDIGEPVRLVRRVTLRWDDPAYRFVEHSYRSDAVDPVNGDMLFTNGHYPPDSEGEHCYTLLDRTFLMQRCGPLHFAQRACYHNIGMRGGEVYLFAVRDITEPRQEWRAYKKEMTGNIHDFALREIVLLYSPDIRRVDFLPETVVVSRDATCGRINNHDCAWTADGDMLFVFSTVNVQMEFMRDRFFPEAKLEKTLELLRLRAGKVVGRTVIDRSGECDGKNPPTEYGAALHTMADGSLRLLWSKQGAPSQDAHGDGLYVCDVLGGGSEKVSDRAIGTFFISRSRLGAAGCDTADLVWIERNRSMEELSYAYMHGIPTEELVLTYMHGQLELGGESETQQALPEW